jgi:hypothetical protein
MTSSSSPPPDRSMHMRKHEPSTYVLVVVDLIRRMSKENPLCGAPRIHGRQPGGPRSSACSRRSACCFHCCRSWPVSEASRTQSGPSDVVAFIRRPAGPSRSPVWRIHNSACRTCTRRRRTGKEFKSDLRRSSRRTINGATLHELHGT